MWLTEKKCSGIIKNTKKIAIANKEAIICGWHLIKRNLKSDVAKVEVTGGINRPPLEESSTSELHAKFEKVAASLGFPEIGKASVGGASDGNLAAAAGAKVLDGLGAVGHGAHAPTEFINVSYLEPRIKLTNGRCPPDNETPRSITS